MPTKILTVGLSLASEATQNEEFTSKVSLLDFDIFLFKPLVGEFTVTASDTYQGKTSLNDYNSFRLKEACEHWRREIKQTVDAGKTVVVFLPSVEEVYVATGQRGYSGTGRNQKPARYVEIYSNYNALPIPLDPVNASGTNMKLASTGAEAIASYWKEFGPASEYKVLLAASPGACVLTKNGDKPVGAIIRSTNSSGAIVLLPNIDFHPDSFFNEEAGEDDDPWTPETACVRRRHAGGPRRCQRQSVLDLLRVVERSRRKGLRGALTLSWPAWPGHPD
jgi:hypothetical protein